MTILKLLGLAALYAFIYKLPLLYFAPDGSISPFFLASGLTLAVLLIGGNKYLVSIFFAVVILHFVEGYHLFFQLGLALASSLGALLGSSLLKHDEKFDPSLHSLTDFLKLVLFGGALGSALTAILGVTTLLISGTINMENYVHNMFFWWIGDFLGVLILTPLILTWYAAIHNPINRKILLESLLIIGLTALMGQIIFLGWFHDSLGSFAKSYLMFLPIVWIAVRMNIKGTTVVLLVTFIQVALGAHFGKGAFANDYAESQYANITLYMITLSIVGMALATYFFDRQRLFKTLRASNDRYQSLFESVNDTIFLMEGERFVDCNPATLKMFGCTREQIIGERPYRFSPEFQPDGRPSREKALEKITEAFNGGETNFEWRHCRYDGTAFDTEVSLNSAEIGEKTFLLAFVWDITERKQAEASLKESELRLRTIIEQSPVGISFSRDGITIDVNTSFLQMYGYTDAAELKGTSVLNRIAPQCRDEVEKRIKLRSLGELTDASYETTGLRKDGSQFPLFVSVRGVMLNDGQVSCAFLIDFTDRQKAEADLRVASIAFESHEGIEITDANNLILRVNQAFTTITGYTAEEVIGKKPDLLSSGRHDAVFYTAMWDSINQTGSWEGELWNRRKNGEIYPEQITITAVKDSGGIVTNYIASFIDISDRKAAAEKIQHLAFFDQLTQLPNRQLLLDRLHQSLTLRLRSKLQGALLFIDLDNFKTLNDLYGHETGDELLRQVAHRLSDCVRVGDTVARLGGDEFVVLLENLSESSIEAAKQTETVAYKILTAIGQRYLLGEHVHYSTPSIGITLFGGHHQTTEDLLKQADIAMYQAKKDGRNTLRFFDMQMQNAINTRAAFESELRQALVNRQFKLHYQVQVDDLGHPLGAEALVRWIHPERGMISPGQFIPIAEATGLILPIGLWVLETACAQIKQWERDAICQNLVICVNVSAKQFHQVDFVAQVQATIKRNAINPKRVKLELTESMLVDDIEIIIVTMNALKAIGVQISLDDFGTGYSSLQYLKRLPLNQLKIDQFFVRDIVTDSSDKAIVRTIIAMAKSLELDVIAEGVESEEQRKFLLENGCDRFQGYLFGKPVPIDQFETMLKRAPDDNPDKQNVQSYFSESTKS
jgi:diguanylate cyclase (GGDEF)-like protein/PAS domain S-box-containing protein